MYIIRKQEPFDDQRRRLLVRAMQAGLFVGGLGWNAAAFAQLFGRVPRKLPEGKSIFQLNGDVRINGKPASQDSRITAKDRITTGADGLLIAAVGGTSFIVRESSDLELSGKDLLIRGMRLLSGRLLSVFGQRKKDDFAQMRTSVATIGIRGTGVYAEADPEKTYFCTCYGMTTISPHADPGQAESLTTLHHDAPKYVLAAPHAGKLIVPAPVINHTDIELMTLEAIVGRTVPFGLKGDIYDGLQQDY